MIIHSCEPEIECRSSPLKGRYCWSDQCKFAYQTALVDVESADCIVKLENSIDSNNIDINEMNKRLTDIYVKAASKTLLFKSPINMNKQRKSKPKRKPWMTNDISQLKREVQRLGRKVQNKPKDSNLLHAFKNAKLELNIMKKKLKHEFYNAITNRIDGLNQNNSKDFWKVLKKNKTSSNSNSSPSLQAFVNHYKTLLCSEGNDAYESIDDSKIQNLNPLDYPFTYREVKLGIKNLKIGKSPGQDQILNEFIKSGSNVLLPLITKLFNKILASGIIPEDWNLVQISSIYKSGDPCNPSNYRGLSVTSCMGKLFNGLLQYRLNSYLETNNLLSNYQFGFRKNHRTTDNIFILKTLINKYLKHKKQNIYACFVDFTKAFDTIDRNSLLYKLYQKGIGGKFYNLIKYMYSNTKYYCKDDSRCSEPFLVTRGVKQGDNLSPTLFNIFIDDLYPQLQNSNTHPPELQNIEVGHLLFADDLILISTSKEGLQSSIDCLSDYCMKEKLTVNLDKTNAMVLSNKKIDTTEHCFYYNHSIIHPTHEYKYLGIIFTSNGKLKYAAEQLADRARKAYYAIKQSLPFYDKLSVKTLLKLYAALIEPIILYGSEVWISDLNININNCDQLPFEKIQHLIFKDILGVQKKASNLAIKYELGTFPICFKALLSMFKYHKRLQSHSNENGIKNPILVAAKLEDDSLYNTGIKENWQGQLNKLRNKLNLPSLDVDEKTFYNYLKNNYINNVNMQLQNTEFSKRGKLLFYSKVRKNYELQDYLKCPIIKAVRSKLTQLRISAHPLEIETGRYSKPCIPKECRFCHFCKTTVEDELHFLYDCSLYDDIRKTYYPLPIYNLNSDVSKENNCKILCNPTNVVHARRLCEFLHACFELRKKSKVL